MDAEIRGSACHVSHRTPAALAPNRLTRAIRAARAAERPLLDLTGSNPSQAGFPYPPDLLRELAHPDGLVYCPDARGLLSARAAVADDYARRNLVVSPESIVLTASTSEAYSLLFKVLCDPGDAVLVPTPGYPLFEHLARLDGVRTLPYQLTYDGAWQVAWPTVDACLATPRIRAVLLVSPNNPTGSFLRRADWLRWQALAAARGWTLIVDEVFSDYALEPQDDAVTSALRDLCDEAPTVVSLGGASKSLGLPSVKIGWMVIQGAPASVDVLRERLEIACDTYLSVATPVQVALPDLLRRGAVIRDAIRHRLHENLITVRECLRARPDCTLLTCEGGWTAVVRVPAIGAEEDQVVRLVEREGVMVHPGYYFDFPHEAYLVTSLLTPPAVFREGWARIVQA